MHWTMLGQGIKYAISVLRTAAPIHGCIACSINWAKLVHNNHEHLRHQPWWITYLLLKNCKNVQVATFSHISCSFFLSLWYLNSPKCALVKLIPRCCQISGKFISLCFRKMLVLVHIVATDCQEMCSYPVVSNWIRDQGLCYGHLSLDLESGMRVHTHC